MRRLLKVEDAAFSYEGTSMVFKHVNFQLAKGEILTILGPNGAGKSTLLSCVSGFRKLSCGSVQLNDKELTGIKGRELARMVGFVPQTQVRTFDFSVREYIAMGRAPYLGYGRTPSASDYERVDAVMEQLHLTHLREKVYTKISGGECQQVLIARVLVQDPQIIMLDEPVNHLDYGNQIRILKLLKQLSVKGYGIILTTHMPDHALLLDGTVGILDRSGHFTVGTPGELLTEEKLYELYEERISCTYVDAVKREASIPYPLDEL